VWLPLSGQRLDIIAKHHGSFQAKDGDWVMFRPSRVDSLARAQHRHTHTHTNITHSRSQTLCGASGCVVALRRPRPSPAGRGCRCCCCTCCCCWRGRGRCPTLTGPLQSSCCCCCCLCHGDQRWQAGRCVLLGTERRRRGGEREGRQARREVRQ